MVCLMKDKALILILLLVLVACDKDHYNIVKDDDNESALNLIETAPSISPDRLYIYYVGLDTSADSNSGIYKALISNPVQQKVTAGLNICSVQLELPHPRKLM